MKTWAEVKPFVDSIEGFLVEGQAEYLFNKVRSLPENARIYELGCWKGKSTAAMAHACHGEHTMHVIDLDPWMAKTSVQKSLTAGNIVWWDEPSVPRMARSMPDSADLIFIDASHTMPNVLCDIANAYRILKPGGWIVVHDVGCDFPDVTAAWNALSFLFSDIEECSTIRAGRKSYTPHETP